MGNTESVQNLNLEGVGFNNELRKSYKQQLIPRGHSEKTKINLHVNNENEEALLRHSRDTNRSRRWTKSMPLSHIGSNGDIIPAYCSSFKVLPQLNDRLKLRSTRNGAILHSGGTISGRKDLRHDQIDGQQNLPFTMQRSRSCIDALPNAQVETTLSHFARARTVLDLNCNTSMQKSKYQYVDGTSDGTDFETQISLHKKYGKNGSVELEGRLKPNDVVSSLQTAKQGFASAWSSKPNKYNKKRKAPLVPTKTISESSQPLLEVQMKSRECVNAHKNITAMGTGSGEVSMFSKPRLYRTNLKIVQRTKLEKDDTIKELIRLEKNVNQRFINGTEINTPSKTELQTGNIRRVNSDTVISNNKSSTSLRHKSQESDIICNMKDIKKPVERLPSASNTIINKNTTGELVSLSVRPRASKIPQLKRTFYFGMSTDILTSGLERKTNNGNRFNVNKHLNENINQTNIKELSRNSGNNFNFVPNNYICNNTETIVDNNLTVHVRPTLPRRQLETPRFSPTTAWRTLVNEPCVWKTMQKYRTNTKNRNNRPYPENLMFLKSYCKIPEIPIKLKLNTQTSTNKEKCKPLNKQKLSIWSSQLDFAGNRKRTIDKNHNTDKEKSEAESSEVSFSDSASDDSKPIDGCDDDDLILFGGAEYKYNDKDRKDEIIRNPTGEIHLFTLSLPRNALGSRDEKVFGFSSLQKLKSTESDIKCNCAKAKLRKVLATSTTDVFKGSVEGDYCDLHKKQQTQHYRNDNWVLHKTSDADKAGYGEASVSIDPTSLTYLTGGKHIMYLPSDTSKQAHKTKKLNCISKNDEVEKLQSRKYGANQYKENMQSDGFFVPNHNSSEEKRLSSNGKSINGQSFGFPSPAYFLQKRRVMENQLRRARKSEAQRKSEIEAMERVEKDFQLNRASEKASIQHQLQAYFSNAKLQNIKTTINRYSVSSSSSDRQEYHIVSAVEPYDGLKLLLGRADPEGAASTSSPT